jgi:hypothetical protein
MYHTYFMALMHVVISTYISSNIMYEYVFLTRKYIITSLHWRVVPYDYKRGTLTEAFREIQKHRLETRLNE